MNILQLEISDLKKIRAIEIHPESGKPVILTGDNGNGKSSVLDAIVLALQNTGLEDPIRHGRPSASIKLTLGADKAQYILERKVTKKGSYLTLTDTEGAPVQKAQTFLNGLLGNYAFDPLEFTRLKSKQQVEALKEAAGLDFSELDTQRANKYATRTEINRQGAAAKARFEAMVKPADDVPTEEVSAKELIATLNSFEEKARNIIAMEKDAEESKAFLIKAKDDIRKIEDQLAQMKADLETCEEDEKENLANLEAAKAAAPTAEQTAAAKAAVEAIDTTNSAVRAAKAYRQQEEELNALRIQSGRLNREIEVIDETKAEAIKTSSLPLDGLELTDDGVMFNGTFFSQLSTAEQIRISTLVAMSQNPELRIIIIREGALMNSANLAMIASLAKEQGYQLWIEVMSEKEKSEGLHIIDGSIAFIDGKPVEAPTE